MEDSPNGIIEGLSTTRALQVFSIALAAIYLAGPFPGSVAVKGGSIVILAFLAFRQGFPILAAALAMSAVGDVLLDVGPQMFVFGLSAFLVAHLIYIAFYLSKRTPKPKSTRSAAAFIIAMEAALLTLWLFPDLGAMKIPVLLYVCALTAMTCTAGLMENPLVLAGAFLFLISDSLIAIAKFKGPFPHRDVLVWVTYYVGQHLIYAGSTWRRPQ